MAREMKISGMDELSRMLEKLGAQAGAVAAKALYYGAGIVADAITAAVDDLDTEPFRFADGTKPRLCSPQEKAMLSKNIAGIAKFEQSGAEVSTSVGLKNAGYGNMAGQKVPIPLIARAINSGTSFRVKQPFFRHAVNKAKGIASRRIADEVGKAVEKLWTNHQK